MDKTSDAEAKAAYFRSAYTEAFLETQGSKGVAFEVGRSKDDVRKDHEETERRLDEQYEKLVQGEASRHNDRLLDQVDFLEDEMVAQMKSHHKTVAEAMAKKEPLSPQQIHLISRGDAEMQLALKAYVATTREEQAKTAKVSASKGGWLSYELESTLAKKANTKKAYRALIDRLGACKKHHERDHVAVGAKVSGKILRCELCVKLRRDFAQAIQGRKVASAADNSPTVNVEEKKLKAPSKKAPTKTISGGVPLQKIGIVTRGDIDALERPTLSMYSGDFARYTQAVREYMAFRSEMVAEVERREAQRAEARPAKVVPVLEKKPERPASEEAKKTRSEQAKAAKQQKERRRKQRRAAEKLELTKVEVSLAQATRVLEEEKIKAAKRQSKIEKKSQVAAVVPAQPSPKSKLEKNQRKRLRQKKAKAKRRSETEKRGGEVD